MVYLWQSSISSLELIYIILQFRRLLPLEIWSTNVLELQDPAVTDIACAALTGLKMGDKILTVRRATARFFFNQMSLKFIGNLVFTKSLFPF